MVKNPPAMREIRVRSLGQEDPPQKGMATYSSILGASLVAQMVKNLPAVWENSAMQETWVQSLGQEDAWRRKWQPPPVFLPEEFHGQRSLAGYHPWVHKESDTNEQLTL